MGRSEELYERACRVTPGGVNSPARTFTAVGGTPRFVVEGSGAHLVDEDGRRYVDLVQSWGALPLGHARQEVVAAARKAVERGSTFGAPTRGEVELAERLVEAVPSLDQVRLVNSGTEATMSAVRLARGATGRTRVLKFAGHYHGHGDGLLAAAGSGVAALALPGSAGVTPGAAGDTVVVPWNDPDAVVAAVGEHGDDLAAILCEPVAANMNLVPPRDGFLTTLRREADRCGALLVFDEVITGFRLGRAGAQGAHGVTPDLTALGKAMGGGFPLAAFGGRGDVMDELAPAGPVYQAGTLSGNPVAVAAALAQLDLLTGEVYTELARVATDLAGGLEEALAGADVPTVVRRHGTLVGVLFAAGEPWDAGDVEGADHAAYARFFHAMLERGVYLPPSDHEVLFPATALGGGPLERVLEAAGEAARVVRG